MPDTSANAGNADRVTLIADANGPRVILNGDIDVLCEPELNAVLDQVGADPTQDVLVDLAAVTLLSSTGLEFLAKLRNLLTTAGHSVMLIDPPATVVRVLTIVGFTDIFPIVTESGSADAT